MYFQVIIIPLIKGIIISNLNNNSLEYDSKIHPVVRLNIESPIYCYSSHVTLTRSGSTF